ncbi:MAG: cell division protein FtsX [Desertimonas sp.]
MISRIAYTLRETWASFRRNMTLTAAAIITTAVSLLIFGLTLLMQRGLDNMLLRWEDGVELIINVENGASADTLAAIEGNLDSYIPAVVESWTYCDVQCSMAEAERVLAGEPEVLDLISEANVPTQYKVVPTEADSDQLGGLQASAAGFPGVASVVVPLDALDVIGKLKDFLGLYTYLMSIVLLLAAILLIWNTIRTAMFARRREIEVMKLVGATDWFIRLPFMLEGLIQGFIGGVGASVGLWLINNRWTNSVQSFPDNSGFEALVAEGSYVSWVTLVVIGIGMVAGAVGSGLAASRFLDV